MRRDETKRNPWHAGRLDGHRGRAQLLFGTMHEDWRIEDRVFPSDARVFCIASAGCTALRLAASGRRVVAVDVNPAQAAYLRRRIAGGPVETGRADRLLSGVRLTAAALGLTRRRIEAFLDLDDLAAQLATWRSWTDRSSVRAALRAVLHPWVLRLGYAESFVRGLPSRFDQAVLGRMDRGIGRLASRENPYLYRLLLGSSCGTAAGARIPSRTHTRGNPFPQSIDVVCADAADYLERCPVGSFEAFGLSNILDGASEVYARRLWRAVRRAAAPGAVIVLRSLGEPGTVEADVWAAADRSMIWGAVRVLRSTHQGFVAAPLPDGRGSDRLRHSDRRRPISRAVAMRGPRDSESSLLQVS